MVLNYEEIGKNIRLQRCRMGLKQAELADLIGVTSQHLCHIETSTSTPSLSVLVEIANVLKTDVNTLLGSNLTSRREETLTSELAEILAEASTGQLALCIELCRAVIKVDKRNI